MKRIIFAGITVICLGFLVWTFVFDGARVTSFSFGDALEKTTREISDSASDLLKTSKVAIEKTVSAPPPLRNILSGEGEELTVLGVLDETNRHRAEAGLPPLEIQNTLNAAAEIKMKDMFAEQYFAHISPSGLGPADLVDAVGYAYLAVGENLALGTYDDDSDLVQAWMDSPGHRENILAPGFTKIGIAVGQGIYEGHTTWLAVQTFARPLSDCPMPDPNLSGQITANKSRLEATKQEADMRLAELEAAPAPKTKEDVELYNTKVAEYNDRVKLINELIRIIQGQVTVYNGQVQAFNACAKN